MTHAARRALDLDAGARQPVQRHAVALQRRVHRRHLLDLADEPRSPRRRSALGPAAAPSTDPRSSRPRRRRSSSPSRASPRRDRSCAPRACTPRAAWRRRKRSAACPSRAGRGCPCGPAFAAANRRLARCSARFDDRPSGLSSRSSPNTSRLGWSGARSPASSGQSAPGPVPRASSMSWLELDGAPGARVVAKPQLRNAPQLQGLRHARAEEAARLLERLP